MSSWSPDLPYNGLPLLPPAEAIETLPIMRLVAKARGSLGELKQASERVSPDMLIHTLPLLEAQASTEIENIVTTTDKLFRSVRNEGNADPATKEALRYDAALFAGFTSLEKHPLSTRTAELVCSTIKGMDMRVRAVPGVALQNSATRQTVYTPPSGESLLRDLLTNWEKFIHEQRDIDPLIRLAVSHYQFEAIHPFTDGNGRTGRVLNSLFLIQENLLSLPVLYLSRYIIANRTAYYDLLRDVTQTGAWEPWILYIVQGVQKTADWTTAKITAIIDLSERTEAFIKASLRNTPAHDLTNLIFRSPYCRISNVVDAGIAQRQTASIYLRQLVNIGVLEEINGGREKLFVHRKLIDLLADESNSVPPYGLPPAA